MKTKILFSVMVLTAILALSACQTSKPAANDASRESEVGMPNPAAVYCEEQGGTVETRTDANGGQYGVCMFDDGSECSDWAYYRGECKPGDSAQVAPAAGLANPASVFCEEHDGELNLRTVSDGGQFGVCMFEDGTECEEWAYFRGECQPGEFDEVQLPPAN